MVQSLHREPRRSAREDATGILLYSVDFVGREECGTSEGVAMRI